MRPPTRNCHGADPDLALSTVRLLLHGITSRCKLRFQLCNSPCLLQPERSCKFVNKLSLSVRRQIHSHPVDLALGPLPDVPLDVLRHCLCIIAICLDHAD